MKKKIVAFISFFILIILMTILVMCFKKDVVIKAENKLQIVATLFPQYDFAKQIVGDKADVELLISSGVETHNYEPTAQDMILLLDNTDMFLYTGEYLEPWTTDIIENLEKSNCKIVDLSKNIELIKIDEFEERYINSEIDNSHDHKHEDAEIHSEGNDDVQLDEYEAHVHSDSCEHADMYDGHIWQSPLNAIIMLENTLNAICKIDPENAEYYKQNAENYKNEILKLDQEIKTIVENAERKEIAVGGEFAYAYFVEEYDLKFVSVYTNCGHGEDPNIAKVKSVIDYINNHKIPVVFYEELSEGTVAKMIAEETNAEAMVLYSIHNGNTNKDTYISLLQKNIENLKKGLK